MSVTILLFSVLKDLAGEDRFHLSLEGSEPSLRDVIEKAYQLHPALRDWDSNLLVAVNCEYADREQVVKDGDEIALMPPVQGG